MDNKLGKEQIQVRLPQHIQDLSAKDKVKLVDSIAASAGARALNVDFVVSHTGKRINRRIYNVRAHKNVANDLNNQENQKPITKDHEWTVDSIIGRFTRAAYEPLVDEAQNFFRKRRLSPNKFTDLMQSLETLDFEKMANVFHTTKILEDRGWKGVGRITASARITDPESIVKFLDKRYMNFSAEQLTDKYVCSICLNDWKSAGPCEHEPGQVYDGKTAIIFCGDMSGQASSVVMSPADEGSIVTSLSLTDADGDPYEEMNKLGIFDQFISDSQVGINEQSLQAALDECLAQEPIKHEIDWSLLSTLEDSIITEKILPIIKPKFIDPILASVTEKDATIAELNGKLTDRDTSIALKDVEMNKIKLADELAYRHLNNKFQAMVAINSDSQTQLNNILDTCKPLMALLASDKEINSLSDLLGCVANVDLVALKNKVESGLQRVAVSVVEDPLLATNTQRDNQGANIEQARIAKYKLRYHEIKDTQGSMAAKAYLSGLKDHKLIDNSFNPEN